MHAVAAKQQTTVRWRWVVVVFRFSVQAIAVLSGGSLSAPKLLFKQVLDPKQFRLRLDTRKAGDRKVVAIAIYLHDLCRSFIQF